MTKQKQLRSCRSKSAGRLSSGEPATPTSNAKDIHLKERRSRSPAHTNELPPEKNNAEKENISKETEQVSLSPSPNESENNLISAINEAGRVTISPEVMIGTAGLTESVPITLGVSDNRETSQDGISGEAGSGQTTTELAKEDPGKILMLVLSELKDIKTQMVKLHQVETTTASLVGQLATNTSKMGELVETVTQNKSNIQNLNKEVGTLKKTVEAHSSQLTELKDFKEEISESSDKAVTRMNELIETQRDQVDSFNEGAKRLQIEWQKEVMLEVNKRFEEMKKEKEKEKYYESLKDQAFRNRYNLVVVGLSEDPEKTTVQIVKNFFSDVLKTPKVRFISSHRLGVQAEASNTYNRPVLIKFGDWGDRNAIWKRRAEIPDKQIRIQADLPKVLREGMPTLYKVANAASKSKEFNNVKVQHYQLELDGEPYQIADLEKLPVKFRPSTLAEPKSETHMVFFSRHSKLSNHYPSQFSIKDQRFASMEHFLATRRAELSGREDLIRKAGEVQDAVQAKHILNTLHGDHQQEWEEGMERTALEGLRAKFTQNRTLQDHLCSTGKLVLGEASTNSKWGIGMDISNEEVLDHSKWSAEGNLLGRSLMILRDEFLKKKKKLK